MITNSNVQNSTIDLLVFQALKQYSTNALVPMLEDKDVIVRSAVARELQIRGGDDVFTAAQNLGASERHESREIAALFVLGCTASNAGGENRLPDDDSVAREMLVDALKTQKITHRIDAGSGV